MRADRSKDFILWFSEIGLEDVPTVGGKTASLGEMYRKLHDSGISIPNGFAITAYAYRYFLTYAGFLVECGIDSASLIPDTVIKTRMDIHTEEKELGILMEND